jgi:hypothetical protein
LMPMVRIEPKPILAAPLSSRKSFLESEKEIPASTLCWHRSHYRI